MNHFSCFSGIGGMDIAAEMAGFETVGQVELDDYSYSILCKHWPNVPKWRDIRDVTTGSVRKCGIGEITVVSGGWPCQSVSHCGKRRGEADDTFLWHEMFRVIQELRPHWFVGENVIGFATMGLDKALDDLERINYSSQTFDIPASAVGADHQRRRLFIVATSNPESVGVERMWAERIEEPQPLVKTLLPLRTCDGQWKTEPDLRRTVYGVSNWTHRLKSLGNSVVPYQAYPFFKAIAEIERMIRR